jgi:translation initiation factor IF-1
MAKGDAVEMDGTVVDALPNSQFTVRLDNGHQLLAYTAGRMRRFRIRILLGDRVRVEMSPYDLARGRVSYRYR